MKDKWKFCQCCYLNGHCENQDRGHKCEHYPKQLEDKVEHLQELLSQEEGRIKCLLERIGEAETIFKIIKRNMENPNWHKDRSLTDLEIAIKSQVVGYLERYGVK